MMSTRFASSPSRALLAVACAAAFGIGASAHAADTPAGAATATAASALVPVSTPPAASAPAASTARTASSDASARDGRDGREVPDAKVEQIVQEDDKVRIEETRVRGLTQKVVVKRKDGTPEYEILLGDSGRDIPVRQGADRGNAGQRVWRVLSF